DGIRDFHVTGVQTCAPPILAYAEGLNIVPILTMGTVFLGIYYNLSIWYKLTNRNLTGAYITLTGAVITILLNIWWIPYFSYTGRSEDRRVGKEWYTQAPPEH